MIEVSVPSSDKLRQSLDMSQARLLMALKAEIKKIGYDLSAKIKGEKLSGQVLNVRSGRLRRSINAKFSETATGIDATVGTNVEYGRVHEFGFKGTVKVREFVRKNKVRVRAHTRRVNLPERSFLRSTFREQKPVIDARIARVIADNIARGAK